MDLWTIAQVAVQTANPLDALTNLMCAGAGLLILGGIALAGTALVLAIRWFIRQEKARRP
jgi:hypothetical protein